MLTAARSGEVRNARWEQFVEVEDDGDEAPPRGSGLFAEVTEAGALVTDPAARGPLS